MSLETTRRTRAASAAAKPSVCVRQVVAPSGRQAQLQEGVPDSQVVRRREEGVGGGPQPKPAIDIPIEGQAEVVVDSVSVVHGDTIFRLIPDVLSVLE